MIARFIRNAVGTGVDGKLKSFDQGKEMQLDKVMVVGPAGNDCYWLIDESWGGMGSCSDDRYLVAASALVLYGDPVGDAR